MKQAAAAAAAAAAMKFNLEELIGTTMASVNRQRTQRKMRMPRSRGACEVCGDSANGVYFGAMVCLPCKSFFIRCTKDGPPCFQCSAQSCCDIKSGNRMRCQACRFNKCLTVGMARREKPETVEPEDGQELCRVCSDIANGLHFGVMTCEGCKKFFRRALKEFDTYTCKQGGVCLLNPRSRNTCRFCRHQKCVRVGMSREAIRMGRPKKAKRGLNGCGYRNHHDLRLSTGVVHSYCNSLGSLSPGAYSPPATAPVTAPATFGPWSPGSYHGALDYSKSNGLRSTDVSQWTPALETSLPPYSPVSPVSSISSASGHTSPSLCPQESQDVKAEPMDVWSECCNSDIGLLNQPTAVPASSFETPQYSNDNSKVRALPEISALINSDVVDSLIQLAASGPKKLASSSTPKPIDTNINAAMEDDAIDSLLKVLEDFEKTEGSLEESLLIEQLQRHAVPIGSSTLMAC